MFDLPEITVLDEIGDLMKLYLIGNGFDLHHGLETSYYHYKKYLLSKSKSIVEEFESFEYFMNVSEKEQLWSNLEESLTLNYDEFASNLVRGYYPDVMSDSDSRWHSMEIESMISTEFVEEFVGGYLFDWVENESKRNVYMDANLNMDKEALYISFNYTDILSRVYDIHVDNILHIHGSVDDGSREAIVFGSGDNDCNECEKYLVNEYNRDQFYGASIEPAVRVLVEITELTSKNIKDNYEMLFDFIEGNTIEEVVIMGHSISESSYDNGYYEDVIIPSLNKDVCWTFYWYREEDKEGILSFINRNKILNYKFIKW